MKRIFYILSLLSLTFCSKPIYLNDVPLNKEGMLSYGFNSNRNFYIDKEIDSNLTLDWIAETDGSFGNSPIATYDKFVFVGDLSGKIFCFSDTSGKKLGTIKQKGEIIISPVISKDKLIYVVNNHKEKYATLFYYQFVQGNMYKEIELYDYFSNEIISTDTGIILLARDGTIYKYNLIGEKEFEFESNALTYSDPFLYKDVIYFGSVAGEIIGFSVTERKIILRDRIAISIEGSPAVNDDVLFIGDVDGKLYAYSIPSNEILWEYETGAKIISQPVVDNDKNIYISNLSGDLNCIGKHGDQVWQLKSDGIFNTAPLVFRNLLFQSDLNKSMLIVNTISGKIEKEIDYAARVKSAPVYYNNKIYICVDRSDVYSYWVNVF